MLQQGQVFCVALYGKVGLGCKAKEQDKAVQLHMCYTTLDEGLQLQAFSCLTAAGIG
jgi:hypothetical protein